MKSLVSLCILVVGFLGVAKTAESQPTQVLKKEQKAKPKSELSDGKFRLLKDKYEKISTAEFYHRLRIKEFIESGKAEEEEFLPIQQLDKLPHLERLVVGYGSELKSGDLESISKLTGIVEIQIGFPGIASEYVTIEGDLSPLAQLKSLKIVRVSKDGIQDDDLRFVAKLPQLHTLEFRADNGSKNSEICTDKCGKYLKQATQLRHLSIAGGQFTDRFVETLVRHLPQLETLQLNSEGLSNATLLSIAKHGKNLRELSLVSDQFTQQGVKALDALPKLKSVSIRSQKMQREAKPVTAGDAKQLLIKSSSIVTGLDRGFITAEALSGSKFPDYLEKNLRVTEHPVDGLFEALGIRLFGFELEGHCDNLIVCSPGRIECLNFLGGSRFANAAVIEKALYITHETNSSRGYLKVTGKGGKLTIERRSEDLKPNLARTNQSEESRAEITRAIDKTLSDVRVHLGRIQEQ